MDEDGFFMGELDGVRGLVPSNFLTEAPEPYNNQSGTASTSGVNAQRNQNSSHIPLPTNQRNNQPTGPGARGPPPPPREIGSIGKLVAQEYAIVMCKLINSGCKATNITDQYELCRC